MTDLRKAAQQALETLENIQITGPDEDGVLWISFPGNGTTWRAILRVGKEGLIVSQCATLFETSRSNAMTALREAIEAAEGYVLVPVEPTKEMRVAGKQAMKGSADELYETNRALIVYACMLAAAPKGTTK